MAKLTKAKEKEIENMKATIADSRTSPAEREAFERVLVKMQRPTVDKVITQKKRKVVEEGSDTKQSSDKEDIEILLFKKTLDSDLKVGQEVAYKDTSGEYSLTGKIIKITTQDGLKLYDLGGSGLRSADELKLIKTNKSSTSELDKLKERGLDEYNVAEAVMGFDSDVTSKLKIESGSELYASDELQKKYIAGLDAKIKPAMFSGIKSIQVFDALEDENYHSLNNYLALKGYIKNEGNDAKKEYTESYRKNPDKFLNPALFEDDKKAPETKKETPSCDELIDKFKVAKKARLERQKNKVEDTRKPETKLKDDAQKKVSSILDNIMKLSKKNKLSKRVKKDILAILKKGIDKAGKI